MELHEKKKHKRIIYAILAAVMITTLFSGCGTSNESEDAETISVYLWSNALNETYAPYIQSQLPDVNIEFVVGNNDLVYL